jgi:asparagine synthase (glutamine-hydrolysing)
MCGILVLTGAMSVNDEKVLNSLAKINNRGPDDTEIVKHNNTTFLFHRLAIMDLSSKGNQPFEDDYKIAVCNGEIYNYQELKKKYNKYNYKSNSDCEVLMPLWDSKDNQKESISNQLDAEYACVILDKKTNKIFASRDPIGIRPLFYGYRKSGDICFASEIKYLQEFCDKVLPFPPGHDYVDGNFVPYCDISVKTENHTNLNDIYTNIVTKLIKGVEKRLTSDAPVGFLLSGGLDSSLVCAIAARMMNKPIITFSTGINTDPIDTKYARIVAEYIGSDHHEVLFTKEDVLSSLHDVIWHLETWDITTIRASIGMYLVCKYIKEKTNIKVLLTGEISDELFGYKYTDFAPSAEEFQKEAKKRIDELFMYDVLRADRCIAANSLEARVPFGDLDFVKYVMNIDPKLKLKQKDKMGKYLLRQAFEHAFDTKLIDKPILPHEILWREKAAFSDAVGHSMVDHLKAYAEEQISDFELENHLKTSTMHGSPFTKESLLYRKIFDKLYPNQAHVLKDFWMPNKEWEGCNVSDPSARVLKNYGKSGE